MKYLDKSKVLFIIVSFTVTGALLFGAIQNAEEKVFIANNGGPILRDALYSNKCFGLWLGGSGNKDLLLEISNKYWSSLSEKQKLVLCLEMKQLVSTFTFADLGRLEHGDMYQNLVKMKLGEVPKNNRWMIAIGKCTTQNGIPIIQDSKRIYCGNKAIDQENSDAQGTYDAFSVLYEKYFGKKK